MTDCMTADSVGRTFGRRRVLSAASLRVPPGRITALLGRNGCGKTTLLRILTGFVRADYGLVEFAGVRLERPRLARLAEQGLFYMPDRNLLSRNRTVAQHFEMLARRFGITDASGAIRITGIGHVLDSRPANMSSGEKRRAELALALFRQPRCLIADEPFLGVAPNDAETIAAALRTLAEQGCGVLVTGHEVEILLDLADDVVWMTAGTTYRLGAPAEARRHHAFIRDYLGPRGGTRAAPPP